MRVLNKSSSTPHFSSQVAENQLSVRPRKHRLQQLQNQVNKSRIAIENMSHTRAIEGGLHYKVEQLQRELHRCILSLNNESEKHKVLLELNNILKGEMNEVQAVQRTSQEFVSCGIQKKIKKVEYDIKQIEHKYNEEIAKINWLKEQANAARDERVVYSNLFNKIQKQIKRYQEIYKQTVIKNQIFLDKKRSKSLKSSQEQFCQNDPIDESLDKYDKIEIKNLEDDKYTSKKDLRSNDQCKSIRMTDRLQENDLFVTNPKEFIKTQAVFFKQTPVSPQKNVNNNRKIQSLIKEKQASISATVVQAQCRSHDQVMSLYTSLDDKNASLINQIGHLDENMSYLQEQIQRLNRQKRSSEIYQNRQLTEIVNISKKSRTNKLAINDISSSGPHNLQDLTYKICSLLQVECENLGDDVLKEIDQKIDDLGCTVIRKHERRDSKMIGNEQTADKGIADLLEKIDRFGESQKIFDTKMLRAEYHKELNKVRKRGKRSN